MVLAFPEPDVATMFMLALSSLWFGASDAVRELIAERSVWRREQRVGQRLSTYMASKITVLGILVTLQCFVLAAINFAVLDMAHYGFSYLELAGACTLTGFVGVSMGLMVSSIFPTSEAAIGSLPLILIPQISFGGLIVTVKEMGLAAKLLSYGMFTRYSFELIIKCGEKLNVPGKRGAQSFFSDIKGPLWNLGFRTSAVEDMGLTVPVLVVILSVMAVVMLSISAWFTARTANNN